MLEREWVSLRDPDDDHLRYTFDVSFLLSPYTCIYGAGCKGIGPDGPDPELGCCQHGAYMTEDDEAERLQEVVDERLGPDLMARYDEAVEHGFLEEDDEGEVHTRVVEGRCIFLNPEGFPGGMGCAFHHLAEAEGEHHMTFKPVVCWQVPIHRTITEETANDGGTLEIHTIEAYERGQWGEGGADFGWWCTEAPEAFVGDRPVYRSMEQELRTMVGDAVYTELAGFLDRRRRSRSRVRFLPIAEAG